MSTTATVSPFTTNLKDFSPRLGLSWQPINHMVVRGGGGFYYGPSAQMVASASLDSDGYSSTTTWNATCLNADGQYRLQRHPHPVAGAAPGSPAPSFTGIYSLSNPFPQGVVPVISAPTGLAKQSWSVAQHDAAFTAHTAHL